jgi:serine protease inhibitor
MSLEAESNFSFNFLRCFNAEKESVIFSPASILTALAMVHCGANSNTAEQIADVIGRGY